MSKVNEVVQRGFLVGRRFGDGKNLLDTPAQGKVVSTDVAERLVLEQLVGCLDLDATIRLADQYYYLPTHDEIEFILEESKLERMEWLADRFDCDDFSFILKGEISSHAYRATQLTCGLCSGIVWGHFAWNKGYHAANWFLDAGEKLHFIEPQWDTIHEAGLCRSGVDLLLA